MKKKWLVAVAVSLVAAAVLYFEYNRLLHNAVFSMPDAFCIYSGDGEEYDLQDIQIEQGKRTYRIDDTNGYLSDFDGYVYVTGMYWDSPIKPVVRVNGMSVEVSRSGNGSLVGGYYHFYIRDAVPNEKYRIYVRCGEKSDYIYVIFQE